MDCAEFQRRLLIDPMSAEVAEAAAARACSDGPSQLAAALALEHRTLRALRVDVPEQLVQRLLAGVPNESSAPPRRVYRSAWALAASLLMAVVGWAFWQSGSPSERLVAVAVDHFAHEPYALTRQGTVPRALVARLLTEAGPQPGLSTLALSYLNRCVLGRSRALHMVLPAPDGPVTVLFVPDERRIERMDTHRDMVAVRILPFASGALILLAESSQDFDRVESLWRDTVGVFRERGLSVKHSLAVASTR